MHRYYYFYCFVPTDKPNLTINHNNCVLLKRKAFINYKCGHR